jgi:hypothetical protein
MRVFMDGHGLDLVAVCIFKYLQWIPGSECHIVSSIVADMDEGKALSVRLDPELYASLKQMIWAGNLSNAGVGLTVAASLGGHHSNSQCNGR